MNSFSLSGIIKSKTITHSAITFGGTFMTGILGLLFYGLVARFLGPNNFGIFIVALTSMTLLSDIANLGTDTGLIRFVSKYFKSNRLLALKFMKMAFKFKLIVWCFVLVLGWIISPIIAKNLLLKPELIMPLRLSLIGVGGILLFSFLSHSLQALEKYWVWVAVSIGSNLTRLILVLLLASTVFFNVELALLIYITIPILAFVAGMFFLPDFLKVEKENSVSGEFFHYNKWVACFIILAAISSRLDTFISARLLSDYQLGIYTAASQLTVVIPQLTFALASVVAPKLSVIKNDNLAILYLKKLQLLTLGLLVLGLFAIPVIVLLIPMFLGSLYFQSIVPFSILFFAQLIFLLALPSHQAILNYFSKPSFFVFLGFGQLIVTAVLGWYLISNWGILGGALTVLVVNIFNFLLPILWVVNQFGERYEKNNLG